MEKNVYGPKNNMNLFFSLHHNGIQIDRSIFYYESSNQNTSIWLNLIDEDNHPDYFWKLLRDAVYHWDIPLGAFMDNTGFPQTPTDLLDFQVRLFRTDSDVALKDKHISLVFSDVMKLGDGPVKRLLNALSEAATKYIGIYQICRHHLM